MGLLYSIIVWPSSVILKLHLPYFNYFFAFLEHSVALPYWLNSTHVHPTPPFCPTPVLPVPFNLPYTLPPCPQLCLVFSQATFTVPFSIPPFLGISYLHISPMQLLHGRQAGKRQAQGGTGLTEGGRDRVW